MPATLSWTGHSRADATPGRAAASWPTAESMERGRRRRCSTARLAAIRATALVSCAERGPSRYWLGDGLDRWSAGGATPPAASRRSAGQRGR